MIMIRNYIRIAARNLWKQKLFSFVNIFGFAIGLTVSFIIVLYVQFEYWLCEATLLNRAVAGAVFLKTPARLDLTAKE